MTTIVYGCSDDLIEVEGDVKEEFSREKATLTFSDGTVLGIRYAPSGVWKIKTLYHGPALLHVDPCEDGDADTKYYSDVAYFLSDLEWVNCEEDKED